MLCLMIATSTAACETSGRGGSYCDNAKVIWMSDADQLTRATERSIITHNETWQRLCVTR